MARTSRGNKKKEVNKNADGTTKPNSSLQKSLDSLQVGRSSSCTIEREREGGEAEADEAVGILHCDVLPSTLPCRAPLLSSVQSTYVCPYISGGLCRSRRRDPSNIRNYLGSFTSSPLHCPLHFPFHCPFPAPATGQAQGQAHEG